MNEDKFWSIIEKAGSPDQCSPEDQCSLIVKSLSELSKQELIDFENIRLQLLNKAYTWPLLKSCFIVLSYVSDDVFEDFRNWIILNGQERFYNTLKAPDFMVQYIAVEDPVEEISGEPLMMVCEEAWEGDIEELEEEYIYPSIPDIVDDWPPKEDLQKEFPNLFDKFWNEEMIKKIHDPE